MSDAKLRDLERAWKSSGSREDYRALTREQKRQGDWYPMVLYSNEAARLFNYEASLGKFDRFANDFFGGSLADALESRVAAFCSGRSSGKSMLHAAFMRNMLFGHLYGNGPSLVVDV